MWGLRLSLAYLFGVALGWGLPGVWVAFAIDFTTRGLLFWARFRGGKWQTLRV
jgi:Na+-driven multidrug efflux pump